jgi:hypothetical protein
VLGQYDASAVAKLSEVVLARKAAISGLSENNTCPLWLLISDYRRGA